MQTSKGIALLLAIIILTAVLGIALTAAIIFANQIKMARNAGDSVVAYYAAESGIEKKLYNIKSETCSPGQSGLVLSNEASAIIDTDCVTYIKSIGTYNDTKRAIEVNF